MNFSTNDIQRVLPHRAPFLFIDKVSNIIPGESGVGIKLVTANEEWLTGHQMAMPSTFFIEIMAQTCAMICSAISNNDSLGQGYLAGFDLSCSGQAKPGDIIEAHVSIIKIWGTLILASGSIMVDGTEIGTGRFTIGLVEPIEGQA